jgi:hypothetical protein
MSENPQESPGRITPEAAKLMVEAAEKIGDLPKEEDKWEAPEGWEKATYAHARSVVRENMELPGDTRGMLVFDAIVATAHSAAFLANGSGMDPPWTEIMGASGSGKTELLRTISWIDPDWFHQIDQVTKNSLVSGYLDTQDPKSDKSLWSLLNEKVVVCPDLTQLLGSSEATVSQFSSQLRRAYDGDQMWKSSGTRGAEKLPPSHFAYLGACTDAQQDFAQVLTPMGSRVLTVLMHNWDYPPSKREEEARRSARRDRDRKGWQARMASAVSGCLVRARYRIKRLEYPKVTVPRYIEEQISKMATLMSAYRTFSNRRDSAQLESPNRCVKQLTNLALCLADLREREQVTEEELETVRLISRHSVPSRMYRLAKALYAAATTQVDKYQTEEWLIHKGKLDPTKHTKFVGEQLYQYRTRKVVEYELKDRKKDPVTIAGVSTPLAEDEQPAKTTRNKGDGVLPRKPYRYRMTDIYRKRSEEVGFFSSGTHRNSQKGTK